VQRWQVVTVVVLVAGYTGYYLCRSNLSVVTPLLIAELEALGWSAAEAKVHIGTLVSLGTFTYAVGKFLAGPVGDHLGGRRNFLIGMTGTGLATAAFAASGTLPLFTLAWVINRLVQAFGWPGMVKVASRWFPSSAHGRVMAILSLSFLFGDALARAFMAQLLDVGLGWRAIFLINAALLLLGAFVAARLLKESPHAIGAGEWPVTAPTVFGSGAEDPQAAGLRALLLPFLRSPAFLSVCGLSLVMTLLRETFNTWTPTYLSQAAGLGLAAAARHSAWFPLLGGCSVLVAGYLNDRLGRDGRSGVIVIGMLLTGSSLWYLGTPQGAANALPLVALAGFTLIGPYSYLAGSVALDFGGKRGSATACGIIDGVGYLAGILAGDTVARLTVTYGWGPAFQLLALSAWAGAAIGLLFWYQQRHSRQSESGAEQKESPSHAD
jgi:OPA family glycerol-3-phosphate transporter-like MFS transporter